MYSPSCVPLTVHRVTRGEDPVGGEGGVPERLEEAELVGGDPVAAPELLTEGVEQGVVGVQLDDRLPVLMMRLSNPRCPASVWSADAI